MLPIISAILPIVSKVLDFIPDPQKKAEMQLKLQQELNDHSEELLKALTAVDTAQIAVNAEEAKSANWFVSAWRPGVAWVCVAAFTWAYVLQPIIVFISVASGHPITDLPELKMGEMMPVLLGLLGLSGLRTWEKVQDVHKEH
jgi:hypothetical protein